VVALECFASFLRHGVKGGLDDVVLVEVGFIGVGVSSFMLDVREVVNSPAESSKYIAT
jgi:hypothetical protein